MGVLFVAVGLLAGYGAALLASREVRFLTRAGLEEMRILNEARPLGEVIADPDLSPETRGLIRLVIEVRDAAATWGLDAGETYTTFTDVGRDTLLLVLSAAPRDCLCPHTWKYPIVGRVPYKGFFDPSMAREEEARLAARGFDTYLRPSGAYSTLGWFNDPLLSTALSRDSLELAATVFHEMAHNTLYVSSATAFNESFAQYAGYRTAEAFFRARGDTVAARRAADRLADEQILGEYYAELTSRLEAFYATRPDSARLDSGRVAIGRWARETLETEVGPRLRAGRIGPQPDRPVNNARLVGVGIYRTNLDLFDAWHARHGGDVAVAVAALRGLLEGATGDEAFARLRAALEGT